MSAPGTTPDDLCADADRGARPESEPTREGGWEARYDELHTPGQPMLGPWTWEIHDYSLATLCGGGEDAITGHIMAIGPCGACSGRAKAGGAEWVWGRCQTPSIDNARLIAAAPDLLKALKAVLGRSSTRAIYLKKLRAARAAIAKAEAR